MSLAEELASECDHRLTTSGWFAQWRATLDDADRASVDDWLADPRKPATVLFRVCRRHGYPRSEKTFRDWVTKQRGDS